MRVGRVRPQIGKPPVMRDGFVALTLLFERISEIEMRIGIVGLERNGAAAMRDHLVHALERSERQRDVITAFRIARLERDRLADEFACRIGTAGLQRQHTEIMQALRMPRLDSQRLAVEIFRLLQMSGLMMLHRERENLDECRIFRRAAVSRCALRLVALHRRCRCSRTALGSVLKLRGSISTGANSQRWKRDFSPNGTVASMPSLVRMPFWPIRTYSCPRAAGITSKSRDASIRVTSAYSTSCGSRMSMSSSTAITRSRSLSAPNAARMALRCNPSCCGVDFLTCTTAWKRCNPPALISASITIGTAACSTFSRLASSTYLRSMMVSRP